MTRSVVLLRGVNVGGHNRLPMAAFRALLEDLGCRDVVTYVQSGNAVVDGGGPDLASRVERALAEQGLDVRVLTRTAHELDAVVAANPLEVDPTMLHAVFLSGQPDPALVDPEQLLPDQVVLGDRVVYVRYVSGSHASAASKLLSSKRFPLVATARNWRTVLALQELAHRAVQRRGVDEPEVGERRATTYYGQALFGEPAGEPAPDATWTVEEWDGAAWRKVGTARGDAERDRLLRAGGR